MTNTRINCFKGWLMLIMSAMNSKINIQQSIPYLRLLVCVLFFPCFFLMVKDVPSVLYFLAAGFFLYSLLLIIFPQVNNILREPLPISLILDLTLISLFIYFEKRYTLPFAFFYVFPIITLALQSMIFMTFLATALAGTVLIYISIIKGLYLPPVIVVVIVLYIFSLYTTFLTRIFHDSYFILANLDTLTKIHNRRYFNYSINSLVKKNVPFSLILLDLDNFKQLNDTEGHHHGDYVLKIVANIMKQSTRGTDIIARYGGDEFAIILPQTSKEASGNIANRIRGKVTIDPKFIPYSRVSLSMGIASYPNDGTTVEEILENADKALYDAKAEGKDSVHLY